MLSLHAARRKKASASRTPKVGLAIAGGGPIGGMYELGALRAMDEALEGFDPHALDCYIGISSGAFLAAGLANRIDTGSMCRAFISGDSDDIRFSPHTFLRPAVFEYLERAAALPRMTLQWWQDLLDGPSWPRIGSLLPTGLFDNRPVERFLRELLTRRGRSNDFRELQSALHIMAVDLDSGEPVLFGSPGWDDVPVSVAVQASAALPGLYPPVELRGRHFVDGALRRTMHASVLLEQDIDLLIGINPLVAFNTASHGTHSPAPEADARRLVEGGLPTVLSQTFRTLLQSRMQVGLSSYPQRYPDVDQIVFEPNESDGELFFSNAFSFSSRHRICQLAYRNTLADLRTRADTLAPVLATHGISLRSDIIEDPERNILTGLESRTSLSTDTTARLWRALDDTERMLSARRRRE